MAESDASPNKTSIIMKVDAPAEEETNQENNSNEENERKAPDITDIKPSHICSPALTRPILTSSRLGSSNPFTSQTGASNSILRPPQLAANSNGRSSFSLNPSRLNPFSKVSASEPSEATTNNVARTNGETPKFVPLLQSEKSNAPVVKPAATPVPPIQTSNFVFGQNLQERVIADNKTEEPKPSTSLNSNGTVDMLFTSAASKAEVASVQGKETKTLSESAREYEESRAVKRKFEEVEIITGEEGETNVLQVGCKLFSFDKASGSWQERGQGNLRLNDFEVRDDGESYTQSRLVFRTVGGLRVILNTKVWAEMTVQEASQKSIRLTAIDGNGEIKVFLIMANKEKIQQLYSELTSRVRKEIERQKNKKKDQQSEEVTESCTKKEKIDTGGN